LRGLLTIRSKNRVGNCHISDLQVLSNRLGCPRGGGVEAKGAITGGRALFRLVRTPSKGSTWNTSVIYLEVSVDIDAPDRKFGASRTHTAASYVDGLGVCFTVPKLRQLLIGNVMMD